MPRHSPGDFVVRDSGAGVWNGMFDGILDEEDFTQSGRLRPSIDGNLPVPSPTNWARDMQRTTPFGRQQAPSTPFSTPEATPQPSPVCPPAPRRRPLSDLRNSDENAKEELKRARVELKVGKAELRWDDEVKTGELAREGLIRRMEALGLDAKLARENEAR